MCNKKLVFNDALFIKRVINILMNIAYRPCRARLVSATECWMKQTSYHDMIEQYENPLENACNMNIGQVFIANGWERPDGMCESAWESMSAFVMTLAHGGEDFYDGWMKNKKSAMISCNDGFRPVSFLIETLDEKKTETDK